MTFVALTSVDMRYRPLVLARIRLTKSSKVPRSRCLVVLTKAVFEAIGASAGQKFSVMIGEGENKGKLRLSKSDDGIVSAKYDPKHKAFNIMLGHVPPFPDRNEPSQACEAAIIGSDTVELALPRWSRDNRPLSECGIPGLTMMRRDAPSEEREEPAAKPEPPKKDAPAPAKTRKPIEFLEPAAPAMKKLQEMATKPRPAPPPPPPPPPAPPPPPPPASAARHLGKDTETYNGITIDFTQGREKVFRGDACVDVSPREAAFAAILARAINSQVGRQFILGKLGLRGGMAEVTLDDITKDFATKAAQLGLKLTALKGFGFCLAEG
jgi:hypothetical protein